MPLDALSAPEGPSPRALLVRRSHESATRLRLSAASLGRHASRIAGALAQDPNAPLPPSGEIARLAAECEDLSTRLDQLRILITEIDAEAGEYGDHDRDAHGDLT